MVPYLGSGPYCYSNSLAMLLGPAAPSTAVLETLTGSPFGMQLIDDRTPFFDPRGWDPEIGLDAAIAALGWRCDRQRGGTEEEALARLLAAVARGPVLVGPVDMGFLAYQPDQRGPGGGDHYVLALAATEEEVLLHDPQGYPYATLPTARFLTAWRADTVEYTEIPFVLRTGFVREREVDPREALRAALPAARRWLAGSVSGVNPALRLAELVEAGLDAGVRGLLAAFGIRVGARRLSDAAACLESLGLSGAAAAAAEVSLAVGGLQLPLVTGEDAALAAGLRGLAPKYEQWLDVLNRA